MDFGSGVDVLFREGCLSERGHRRVEGDVVKTVSNMISILSEK